MYVSFRIITLLSIQNLTKYLGIMATIKAGKHLHAVFLLIAEQRNGRHDVVDVQSDCREIMYILMSLNVM